MALPISSLLECIFVDTQQGLIEVNRLDVLNGGGYFSWIHSLIAQKKVMHFVNGDELCEQEEKKENCGNNGSKLLNLFGCT